MKPINNWYVITGAPSSGKTTIIKLLEKKGYKVVCEAARLYINQELRKAKTLQQIRNNELSFQRKILKLKIACESRLNPKDIVFLDRAIPDTIAYCKFLGIPKDKYLDKIVKKSHYKKIFFFKQLEFEKDYARTESKEEAVQLERLLEETYRKLGFPIVEVPKMDIEKRLRLILNHL